MVVFMFHLIRYVSYFILLPAVQPLCKAFSLQLLPIKKSVDEDIYKKMKNESQPEPWLAALQNSSPFFLELLFSKL